VCGQANQHLADLKHKLSLAESHHASTGVDALQASGRYAAKCQELQDLQLSTENMYERKLATSMNARTKLESNLAQLSQKIQAQEDELAVYRRLDVYNLSLKQELQDQRPRPSVQEASNSDLAGRSGSKMLVQDLGDSMRLRGSPAKMANSWSSLGVPPRIPPSSSYQSPYPSYKQ
jgi:hypothetical protein